MEVTALCIRLLMNVLFLLCAHDQEVDAASLRVDPNRLQFFEYEAVTFHCEGLEGLSCKTTSRLKPTESSCAIKNAFLEDSGEYWCEDKGGRRSNSINITVTTGSVILESPARPVTEGDTVTLCCRNKTTSSNLTADFYKDGRLIRSNYTGNMAINSVSKSDEGLYRCHIPGAGGSPESRLTVRDSHKETTATSSSSTPWIVTTLLLLFLLLVVGLLHLGKGYWNRVLNNLSTLTRRWSPAVDQRVSIEAGAADGDKVVYAAVTKNRRKKDEDALVSAPLYYTLGLDEPQQLEPGASTMTATPAVYSTVQLLLSVCCCSHCTRATLLL